MTARNQSTSDRLLTLQETLDDVRRSTNTVLEILAAQLGDDLQYDVLSLDSVRRVELLATVTGLVRSAGADQASGVDFGAKHALLDIVYRSLTDSPNDGAA